MRDPRKLARAAIRRLVHEMVLHEGNSGTEVMKRKREAQRAEEVRIPRLSKRLRERLQEEGSPAAEDIGRVVRSEIEFIDRGGEGGWEEAGAGDEGWKDGSFEEKYGPSRVKVAHAHISGQKHKCPQRLPLEIARSKQELFKKTPTASYVNRHRAEVCMDNAFSYMIENIAVPLESRSVQVSEEMAQQAKLTFASYKDTGLWHDVIASRIAKPLDAMAFCSAEAQRIQPGTALQYIEPEQLQHKPEDKEDRSTKWKRLKPNGQESKMNQRHLQEVRSAGKLYNARARARAEACANAADLNIDSTVSLFPYSVDAHEAATLICRCWRRYIRTLGLFAAKFQSLVRGVITRKYVKRMRYVWEESACHMQGLVRGFLGRLVYVQLREAVDMGAPIRDLEIYDILTSPCKIRHELARYHLDHAIIERRRSQHNAATVLQCCTRNKQAKRKVQAMREQRARELKATVGLQRLHRGHLARMIVNQKKATFYPGLRKLQATYRARLVRRKHVAHLADRERKALQIQRVFRGMKGRKEARSVKRVYTSATLISSMIRSRIAYKIVDRRRQARMQKERERLTRERKVYEQVMKDREIEVRSLLKQSKDWKKKFTKTISAVRKLRKAERKARKKLSKSEQAIDRAKEAFRSCDIDDSGTIDTSEFALVLESLCIRLAPDETQAALEALDADCNGTLDLDEFVEWYTELDKAKVTKPLTRFKLKAMRNLRHYLGFDLRRQARHAVLKEERAVAKKEAVTKFRKYEPADEWYHTYHMDDWEQLKRRKLRKSVDEGTKPSNAT